MDNRNTSQSMVVRRGGLLIEAAAALIVARIAVRWIPFRKIMKVFTRPVFISNMPDAFAARTCKDVVCALRTARRRLPGDYVCFPRALAAAWMLRRRGIATDLYYGAQVCDAGVETHVWLTAGDIKLTGCMRSAEFQVVARYSNSPLVGPSDFER